MASPRTIDVATSPKGGKGESSPPSTGSDKSPRGMCLCSPTTHHGSFRCKFHRSQSSSWMRRPKSMSGEHSSHSPSVPASKTVEPT